MYLVVIYNLSILTVDKLSWSIFLKHQLFLIVTFIGLNVHVSVSFEKLLFYRKERISLSVQKIMFLVKHKMTTHVITVLIIIAYAPEANAQTSLRICAVSSEHLLLTH